METKGFLGSKINVFNLLSALLLILEQITSMNLIPPNYIVWVVLGVNIITIILRTFFTDTKIEVGKNLKQE